MKVVSLKHLCDLAGERRSVLVSGISKPKPAAFLIGMPGRVIQRYLDAGMVVYEKRE